MSGSSLRTCWSPSNKRQVALLSAILNFGGDCSAVLLLIRSRGALGKVHCTFIAARCPARVAAG